MPDPFNWPYYQPPMSSMQECVTESSYDGGTGHYRTAESYSAPMLPPDGWAGHYAHVGGEQASPVQPSGNPGWSLWRFDGTVWTMLEDHSDQGAIAVAPQQLGQYVGQIVKTNSFLAERDDSQPRDNVADDPCLFEEIVERAMKVPGYATEAEIRWIVGTAASLHPCSTWIEVGAMCGRSFLAAGLALPSNSALMTVDKYLGQQTRQGQDIFDAYREVSQDRWDLRISLVKAGSVEAAISVHDHSADVVYIDANHTADAVQRDIQSWACKVKPGGMLCGHDYGRAAYPGLTHVVDCLPGSVVAVDSIWVWHPWN